MQAFASTLSAKISSHTRLIENEFLSNSNSSGVLSNTFPAALALGSAVGSLLDLLAGLVAAVMEELRTEGERNSAVF